jgi:hypothetical protein
MGEGFYQTSGCRLAPDLWWNLPIIGAFLGFFLRRSITGGLLLSSLLEFISLRIPWASTSLTSFLCERKRFLPLGFRGFPSILPPDLPLSLLVAFASRVLLA